MKQRIRSLLLIAALVLPTQAFAAEGMLLAQQQGQYPPGAMQGQPQQGQPQQGQPQQGTTRPKGGQPQGMMQQGAQPQGMQQGGSPGMQQPRQPMTPPVVVSPVPPVVINPGPGGHPPQQPEHGRRGHSANNQYNAVMRCNQRQASCAQSCNRRTYGQTRNICNTQCNAAFVNCTTRANMR